MIDIFAVGKFDYGVMVRYQNLTRKPELFRAPLGPGPGTMYPPEPPSRRPCQRLARVATIFWKELCYPQLQWREDGLR